MNLNNDRNWLLSIIAVVALFVGGGFIMSNDSIAEAEQHEFTNLSDADIDFILSVKAEMQAAKIRSN